MRMWPVNGYPHGSEFSRGFKASSLFGIARLACGKKSSLPEHMQFPELDETQVLQKYSSALKDEIYKYRLWNEVLRQCWKLLQFRNIQCANFENDDLQLTDANGVQDAINILKIWYQKTSKKSIEILKGKKDLLSVHFITGLMIEFLQRDSKARPAFLESEAGFGVACLTSLCGTPKRELEFDCRGSTSSFNGEGNGKSRHAVIQIGEIKRVLKGNGGIQQLTIRLNTLEYAHQVIMERCYSKKAIVRKVGYLFHGERHVNNYESTKGDVIIKVENVGHQ